MPERWCVCWPHQSTQKSLRALLSLLYNAIQDESGKKDEQDTEDSVFTQLFTECTAENKGWAPVDRLISYVCSSLLGAPPSSSSEEVYDSDRSVSDFQALVEAQWRSWQ